MSNLPTTLPVAPITTADVSPIEIERVVEQPIEPVVEKDQVINEKQAYIPQESVNFPVKTETDHGIKLTPEETSSSAEPVASSSSNNINPSAILESTLDNLATISSKINPIAEKLGKGLGQVRQVRSINFFLIIFLFIPITSMLKRNSVLLKISLNFLKNIRIWKK